MRKAMKIPVRIWYKNSCREIDRNGFEGAKREGKAVRIEATKVQVWSACCKSNESTMELILN